MRFIPKKVLTEAEANPLETNGLDLSYDEQYKQAILKAVASEANATTEYSQILALEEKVSNKELVEHFHDTLEDLKNEEIKHIAQLTTKISEIPDMREAYNAGVEEANSGEETSADEKEDKAENEKDKKEDVKESVQLKEAVEPGRKYDTYSVQQAIANVLNLNDKQYEIIEDIFRFADDELTAEEVDNYIEQLKSYFDISANKQDNIENIIIQSADPQLGRKEDFASDIKYDISTIEDAIENVYSLAAKEKLYTVIDYLKGLEYDGDKNIGWRPEQTLNAKNGQKRIIA